MTYILTDIEGTTTSISFVHDVLFPYSEKRLKNFVSENISHPDIQNALRMTKETAQSESALRLDDNGACDLLLQWIKSDRKHPALKSLQGHIWQQGYENGEVKAHIYPEVPGQLTAWKKAGHILGVYSSGSVKAQHLLFQYSVYGDLRPNFSHYFDTAVGHKREVESYKEIIKQIGLKPEEVLFLSDIKEELDAARAAGLRTTQLVRQANVITGDHPQAKDFTEIRL